METRPAEASGFHGLRCTARLREGYFLDKQVALWIYEKTHDALYVATRITTNKINEGERVPETVVLSSDAAQELMDSLWTCGVRPSNGEGSVGQLGAVQYHLEDMRRLVFEK